MTTPGTGEVSREEFQVIVRRAGLDLGRDELEHLLPIYRRFAGQLAMLHEPDLPLDLPAVTFLAGDGG